MAQVSARIEFRMSSELKSEVEEAASLVGLSLTAFATEALLERARRVKREYSATVLNDEERDAFLKLLAEPAKPSEALRELMRTEVVL
jgi:uncharacterized protein (DUF1778 family)